MYALILTLALLVPAPTPPTLTVTADCTSFTIEASGLPTNEQGLVGVAGVDDGPSLAVFNGTNTFHWINTHSVHWYSVATLNGLGPVQAISGHVDCPELPTIQAPVESSLPALAVGDVSTPVSPQGYKAPLFPGLELAPPW